MKHSEAVKYLEMMMFNIQRIRSNAAQDAGLTEDQMAWFEPWIFGKDGILPTLIKQLDLIRTGEKRLEPIEFYNFMTIAKRSMLIQGSYIFFEERKLPDPDIQWIRGWEPEESEVLSGHSNNI